MCRSSCVVMISKDGYQISVLAKAMEQVCICGRMSGINVITRK